MLLLLLHLHLLVLAQKGESKFPSKLEHFIPPPKGDDEKSLKAYFTQVRAEVITRLLKDVLYQEEEPNKWCVRACVRACVCACVRARVIVRYCDVSCLLSRFRCTAGRCRALRPGVCVLVRMRWCVDACVFRNLVVPSLPVRCAAYTTTTPTTTATLRRAVFCFFFFRVLVRDVNSFVCSLGCALLLFLLL